MCQKIAQTIKLAYLSILKLSMRLCHQIGAKLQIIGSTETYKAFEARLAQLTQEAFGGEYVKVKEVYIIKPATKEWIANRLLDVYEHYPSFEKINKEACAKIIQTSQLSCITGKQRREFVDINMDNKQSDKLKDLVASEK